MKILEPRSTELIDEYSLVFDRPKYVGSSYAFGCDKEGHVNTKALAKPALRNLMYCTRGTFPDGEQVVAQGVHTYTHLITNYAIGECAVCSQPVTLQSFTNTCACGADYNHAGQHLAPRSQWGEETGESVSDILGADVEDPQNWWSER